MARPKKTPDLRPSARNAANDEYVSQFHIDPELLDTHEYHFAWVVTACMGQPTQDISNAQMRGYEPVLNDDFPELAKRSAALRKIRGIVDTDPYVRNGDQILMKCPKAIYLLRQRDLDNENNKQLKHIDMAAMGDFKGAPTQVRTNKYSRTVESDFASDE